MAGVSEVFNLDFKFGGNAEFLSRLENLMQRIDARFESTSDDINEATAATKQMATAVDDLNDSFKTGVNTLGSFGEKLKDVAKYYLSFQAIRSGAERIWSFGMQSMDAYSTQERAENQLKGVMKNRGNLDQFQAIKNYAAQIQGRSIYGDEALIKGAGELATYVKGTGALKSMMNLLTDYAAGMTGGGEVGPDQMESLATGLGMAYDGNYMAMRKKGFDTSRLEALDAIAESGGRWGAKEKKKFGDVLSEDDINQIRELGGVSEQMRVDALKESLKDWEGLSDAVNKLDSSALIRFNNSLGDLREMVGQKVYPAFNQLVSAVDSHMPEIEALFDSFGQSFESLATTIKNNMSTLIEIGSYITEVLPRFVELGMNLINVTDAILFKFVGLKDALIALSVSFSVFQVIRFRTQIKSSGIEIKKTTLELFKACVEMRKAQFTIKETAATMASLGRSNLNKALSGATAQMLLFAGAIWGLEKIVEAARAAIDLYGQKKKEDAMNEVDEEFNVDKDAYLEAARRVKTKRETLEAFRKEHGYRDIPGAEGYYDAYGNQIVGLENEDAFFRKNLMAEEENLRRAKAKFESAQAWRNLRNQQIFGGVDKENNPYLEELKKHAQESTKGDVNIHTDLSRTNITQNVTLAADIQKVGILLNQNIRSIIEKQMRQNREVSLSSGL